jgi:hypothetical protein
VLSCRVYSFLFSSDVRKLLTMSMCYQHGERQVWHAIRVPSVEAEDQHHLHEDLENVWEFATVFSLQPRRSGSQQGVARPCAVWTCRSGWGRLKPQGFSGATTSLGKSGFGKLKCS